MVYCILRVLGKVSEIKLLGFILMWWSWIVVLLIVFWSFLCVNCRFLFVIRLGCFLCFVVELLSNLISVMWFIIGLERVFL